MGILALIKESSRLDACADDQRLHDDSGIDADIATFASIPLIALLVAWHRVRKVVTRLQALKNLRPPVWRYSSSKVVFIGTMQFALVFDLDS